MEEGRKEGRRDGGKKEGRDRKMNEGKCFYWLTSFWNTKLLTYAGWKIDFTDVVLSLDTKKYDA